MKEKYYWLFGYRPCRMKSKNEIWVVVIPILYRRLEPLCTYVVQNFNEITEMMVVY